MPTSKTKIKLRVAVVHDAGIDDLAQWVGRTLLDGCSREVFVMHDDDVVFQQVLPEGHVASCEKVRVELAARDRRLQDARSGSCGGDAPFSIPSADDDAGVPTPPADATPPPPYCCAYKPCKPKNASPGGDDAPPNTSPKIIPCSPHEEIVKAADLTTLPVKTLFVICFADGMTDDGRVVFKQIHKWAEEQPDTIVQAVNGKNRNHNFWTRRMSLTIIQGNLVATISRKLLGQRRMKRSHIERREREAAAAVASIPALGTAVHLNALGGDALPVLPGDVDLEGPVGVGAPAGRTGDGEGSEQATPPVGATRVVPANGTTGSPVRALPAAEGTPSARHVDPAKAGSSTSSTPASTPSEAPIGGQRPSAPLPAMPTWQELPPEPVHYDDLTPEAYEELMAVTNRRLREHQREYTLKIGVDPAGGTPGVTEEVYTKSVEVLKQLAKDLSCGIRLVAEKAVAKGRMVGEYMLRKDSEDTFIDMRIAVCGNVDSGKSTLVGVLTRGQWDDGRGLVRSRVFIHKHEKETGRTSAVSEQHLGFDSNGNTVNYAELGLDPKQHHHKITPKELSGRSAKVVTLYDLAGHERYLKTTVQGITGSIPDYACIVISANNGIQRMTKEHLGLCLALKIPFFVVITRVDSTPPPVIKATLDSVTKMLKMPSVKKLPYLVKKKEDVIICAKNIKADRIAPIFMVSNVTGEKIDWVVEMMNLSPIRKDWEALAHQPKELVIDSTFFVAGVGTVVGGIVSKGTFKVNDHVYLGPSGTGAFRQVQIKSIQVKGVDVQSVGAGHDAAFALKKEKRNAIRKGNVLLEHDAKHVPCAYREFCADIIVLYHSTTIKSQYEPVIHCSTVRQSAKITLVDTELLRTGDKARVRFKFLYRAEYLTIGSKLVFREGRTKGLGTITGLLHPATGEWIGADGTPMEKPAAAAPARAPATTPASSGEAPAQ